MTNARTALWYFFYFYNDKQPKLKQKIMNAPDAILAYMKANPVALRPGEIAEACKLDKKEAEKAIKTLKDSEQIYSPKRCFYQVK